MLRVSGDPAQRRYDFQDDLDAMANDLHTGSETLRAAIRFLESQEYVKFIRDQHGHVRQFALDHKGLHWKEFHRSEIVEYFREKWIDFLALLAAIAALLISLSQNG